ncbi:MAG TPA: hypothetical protein PKA50_05380 [Gemmatimonadales bacterium]|nr:hypothetical protein [Gemmatimonadales bacterium]
MPVLGTSTAIRNLTLQPAASLTLIGTMTLTLTGDLDDAGNLTSGGGGTQTIDLTGAARTLRSTNIPNPIAVSVTGTYALSGRTALTDLLIGTGGDIVVNGQTLAVGNLFNTTAGGTLTMTNPLDSVLVTGTANFGGGATTGRLTAGVLQVGGSLTQSGNSAALAASGTHKTRLTGANPTISIQSPGPGAGASQLQELEWAGGGTLTLGTGLYVLGTMTLPAGGTINAVSFTQSVHAGLFANGAPVTFTNVQLWIEPATAVPVAVSDLTFTSGSSSRLYIRHPGLPGATPLTLTNIVFTTVPPFPAVYLDVDDTAPLDNNAVVVNLFNPTPAASGGLVNATNGAVVNWPAAAPVVTWTGAVSNDWSTPGNWSTGSVPGLADDVLIPAGAPAQPTVTSTCAAKSLTVNSGGALSLGAFNCQVQGNVVVSGAILSTTGAIQLVGPAQINGNLPGLIINAPVTVAAATGLGSGNGNITIDGATASLTMNGQTLVTPGSLVVQNGGRLIMTNPFDVLTISSHATFDGASELGSLTDGVLSVFGNFTQLASTSGESYHPTAGHTTVLGSATLALSFATPGSGAGTSGFQDLAISPGNTLSLALGSDVVVRGALTISSPATTVSSTNRLLTSGDLAVLSPIVFDNTRLAVTATASIPAFSGTVTFQNMNPTATQLALTGPGTGTPVTLTGAVFSTAPTGGGLYLSATDTDGPAVPFTVDLVNPTPGTAGGFIQAVNGAVINWPAAAGVVTWTGAVDSDWNTAGNWSTGSVPTATDDVLVPAGPANQPQLGGSVTVNGFTLLAGATLSLGDVTLTVDGPAAIAGGLVGCCSDFVDLRGGGTLEGAHDNVTLSIAAGSVVALSGDAALTASTVTVQGELILAGHRLDLGQGSLNTTTGTGLLTMTNPADLVIAGFADFSGGDETGRLTAGNLQVQSLSQGSGGAQHPASFFASGNHRVALGGPSSSSVTFADPGTSRFQELDVSGVSATLTLGSNVTVAGQLVSLPSGTPPVINGTAVTLTAGGADVDGLGFSGVPLVLSGGTIAAFSNVAFDNQSPVGTALTVNNVGQGAAFTFDALNFSTTLTAGGFHLVANDLDGPAVPLTIDVTNSVPAAGSPFFQANNGAVINWPPAAPVVTWTGAVSSDWFTPGNWSTGAVPALTDDVLIPAGPTNAPVLSGTATIRDLTIAAGAPTVEVASFALAVTGDLNSDGTITSTPATGGVTLSGFAKQLRGTFDLATLLINGDYSLSGRLATTNGTGVVVQAPGALQLNGHTADVGGLFTTSAGGLLVMLNSQDSLLARGGALFAGGDESVQLNAGVLVVSGDLIQSGGNPAAFAPSGSHKTVLNSAGAATLLLSGVGSHLHLTEIAAPAGIALGSRVTTTADLTVTLGQLDLNANALIIGGDFSTSGGGTVRMVNAGDSLVAVNQTWAGADPTGNITDGTIVATGNFTQGGTPSVPGFAASGSNLVRLEGGTTTLTTVGSNATTVFANLGIATSGPVTLNSTTSGFNMDGTGTLDIQTPVAVTYVQAGSAGALSFAGGTFTAAGSTVSGPHVSLFPGSTILGGWTVDSTGWAQGAAASLQVPNTLSYNHLILEQGNNFFFDPGTFSIPGSLIMRVVNAGVIHAHDIGGVRTLLNVGGLTQVFGHLQMEGGTLTTGSLDVATLGGSRGFLSMLSIADSVTVLGNANFNGGSTSGLLTAGVLRIGGNFTQGTGSSVAAFAPSGTHLTQLGAAAARTVSFASPGAGAAGSHFQALDLSAATGGLTLLTAGTIADSVLASNTSAKLIGGGNGLTMRRSQISGLTVDNTPLVLDEQGVFNAQNFSNVDFQGFPTTGTTMFRFSGPGGTLSARPAITTTNVNFQSLPIGAGNLYMDVTSTNGGFVTFTMTGSNQSPQIGGNGPTNSNPANQVRVNGALVSWP